jgi:signal transduction histidine kinase
MTSPTPVPQTPSGWSLSPIRSVGPILGASAIVGIALSSIVIDRNAALCGIILAVCANLAVQLGLICWVLRRVKSRITAALESDSEAVEYMLKLFPLLIVFHLAASAVLVIPTALIVYSSWFGLGPQVLLQGSTIPLLGSQIIFLLPVFVATRRSARLLISRNTAVRCDWWHRRTLSPEILPFVAVPSLALVFGMLFVSEHLIRNVSNEWLLNSYQRAIETAMAVNSAKQPNKTSIQLTRFDLATPFYFSPSEDKQHGIDRRDLSLLKSAVQNRSNGLLIAPEYELGFIWQALDGSKTIGGVKVILNRKMLPFKIVFTTFAAVLLICVFLSLRRGTQLRNQLDYLASRFEALPDQDIDRATPNLPHELRNIDRALNRLKGRFEVMRFVQQEAIESSRQAREIKSHFFAGMSHDLRSPLNSVIGFTDLLLKGIEGDISTTQQQYVRRIAGQAENLMVLISDILDTSKMNAGSFELDCDWVPSAEILSECVTESRRLIGQRSIELRSEFQPGLPPAYIDKSRIHQALVGLLIRVMNALEQGTFTLKATVDRQDDNRQVLRIDLLDPARGMNESERNKISAAFHSVDGTTSRSNTGGMGIGIALTRDIIRLHGGDLRVLEQSQSGIVFSVLLPLDESSVTG